MDADELIARLDEDEMLLHECKAEHHYGACELIRARMSSLKRDLADITSQSTSVPAWPRLEALKPVEPEASSERLES